MEACDRCGRRVPDGSVDFGLKRVLVLKPTCIGIDVRLDGESIGFIAVDELRTFLEKNYA